MWVGVIAMSEAQTICYGHDGIKTIIQRAGSDKVFTMGALDDQGWEGDEVACGFDVDSLLCWQINAVGMYDCCKSMHILGQIITTTQCCVRFFFKTKNDWGYCVQSKKSSCSGANTKESTMIAKMYKSRILPFDTINWFVGVPTSEQKGLCS